MLTTRRQTAPDDDGFTLIELIISVGLLGVVMSVLALVSLTAARTNLETEQRLDLTRDEQFIAAYFASDVAGADDVVSGGTALCGTGTAVVTLVGHSFVPGAAAGVTPTATTTVASYVLGTTTVDGVAARTLTRQYCEASGTPPFATPSSSDALAARLATAATTVGCFTGTASAACSAATTSVSVAFPRLGGGSFTLTGTRRGTTS